MQPIIIGISSGFVTILLISFLKQLDKATVYALILAGIGYLYVGFTWSDITSLIFTAIQALVFMLIAYFGVKNMSLLALGYFLHGLFDLVYGIFPLAKLIPPHYDLFCLSIDFTMGIYLVAINCHKYFTSGQFGKYMMKTNWSMPQNLVEFYNAELQVYKEAMEKGDLQKAWHHLERAHILGQLWFVQHSFVHWKMLGFGIRIKSGKEILGQLPRLLLGGVKSFVGRVPVGNTGGANVPPLRHMEIPADLKEILGKALH